MINIYPDTEVVAEASNGRDAVDLYRQFRPDLVTMDITMPQLNGVEALREIRKFDPHARVAMVSSIGQQPVILEAIRIGAFDFIVKPFKKERIIELFARYERHKNLF